MKNWILNTKLGHFTFLMIVSIILLILFCTIFNKEFDSFMVLGALSAAVIFSIFDNNKRWL